MSTLIIKIKNSIRINILEMDIYLVLTLAFLFFIEYLLFQNYASYNIINFYPQNFDQQYYLLIIYFMHSNALKNGIWETVSKMPILANGPLFPLQAFLFILIKHASRYYAVLLNFIYFIALQLTAFSTLKSLTTKNYLPILFLGLLLLIKTPFQIAGNLFDFRMDFIAFCLYGIFTSAVIKSHVFLNRKWMLAALCLALLLVGTRFLTLAYLTGLLFSFLLFEVTKLYYIKTESAYLKTKQRIKNIAIFIITFFLMTIPYAWIVKSDLYNYYVIGHITGSEKYLRAIQGGLHTSNIFSLENIMYYPKNFIPMYLHHAATTICCLLLLFLLFRLIFSDQTIDTDETQDYFFDGLIFLALAILIPIGVLTLDLSKSLVVIGIISVPTIWLVMIVLQKICQYFNHKLDHLLLLTAVFILFLGVVNQYRCYQYQLIQMSADTANITKMYLDIGDYAQAKKWPVVSFSTNRIDDSMSYANLVDLYYEQKHKFLNASRTILGDTLFEISPETIKKSLNESNVVILAKGPRPYYNELPFDRSVAKNEVLIQRLVAENFKKFNTYSAGKTTYVVYVK